MSRPRLPAVVIAMCALAAPGAHAAERLKSLALVTVSQGEGFSEKQVRTIEEVILASLEGTRRFKVVGRADIDALLTLDARKQVAGCADDAGCLAQIAGAYMFQCSGRTGWRVRSGGRCWPGACG